ncbi:MAG: PaaI family thioesterase [Anaerovoracaceae bacterium]|jgi:acyl-coenzyme A thioesterase PaaI-like protein
MNAEVKPKKVAPFNSPYYKKCFVCGPDNPAGLHLKNEFISGKAHMEFTPTDNMAGLTTNKNTLMHGGFTCMLFDEVMMYAVMGIGIEAVTLNISIDYLSPARIGHRMAAEAWITERERKKIWVSGEINDLDTGELVAKAEGLYYQVDMTAFINDIDKEAEK